MIEVLKRKNKFNGEKYIKEFGEFYYCPVVDGKEYSHIGETEDVALLIGLGIKYDGLNGQFPKFACRMLNIESEWRK